MNYGLKKVGKFAITAFNIVGSGIIIGGSLAILGSAVALGFGESRPFNTIMGKNVGTELEALLYIENKTLCLGGEDLVFDFGYIGPRNGDLDLVLKYPQGNSLVLVNNRTISDPDSDGFMVGGYSPQFLVGIISPGTHTLEATAHSYDSEGNLKASDVASVDFEVERCVYDPSTLQQA
jgi:hypothetical protein